MSSSYARNFFLPASVFGIGSPEPVRAFPDAIKLALGSRSKLVFVDNGHANGDISRVIQQVSEPARSAGAEVEVLPNEQILRDVCRNSLQGVSRCIGAVVFYSSPTEGPQGSSSSSWNYSIRADGALGAKIVVDSSKNDAQTYTLPLQHEIDLSIASISAAANHSLLPDRVQQYPYTSESKKERQNQVRVRFMGGIISILGVAFFINIVGVTYQMTGLIASERESGMSQLLDCQMASTAQWQPQFARFLSSHLAFDVIYGPGWIVSAIILSIGVFSKTSVGILLISNILAGLSLSSMSNFCAAFFRKAQLSGISVVIAAMLLGVVAQVIHSANTGAIAILSLLFPPINYTSLIVLLARWERQNTGTNLVKSAPQNPSKLPGIVFWIFFIIQIFVYPVLGALVERALYGRGSKHRSVSQAASNDAIVLSDFTKEYRPGWFAKHVGKFFGSQRKTVLAVNGVSLKAVRGQIMVLLGANGSGKSTTLDAVAGLTNVTAGHIDMNTTPEGGFGLCPQKNVLWDLLTVQEHVKILNSVKSYSDRDSVAQIQQLLAACDIDQKSKAFAGTLSGGQKRKLQLAMMFTGGSSVCCIDEVSSGLDPISRRKIWDILLAERGKRSMVLTTHFLDEADILSDHIAVLSKGTLRCEGTAVELKHRLGSGYEVHVQNTPKGSPTTGLNDIKVERRYEHTVFTAKDSAKTVELLSEFEKEGITDYEVSGPTIEDVFLKVADEIHEEDALREGPPLMKQDDKQKEVEVTEADVGASDKAAPQLVTGKRIGFVKQAWILFKKRASVLQHNYLPFTAAGIIPIIAAGLVTLFLKRFNKLGCSPEQGAYVFDPSSLASQTHYELVVGPRNSLSEPSLRLFANTLTGEGHGQMGGSNFTGFLNSLHFVDTMQEFKDYINTNYANVTPGGVFVGDSTTPPTFAWQGNGDLGFATIIQNALDVLLTNVSISQQFQAFDQPWTPDAGKALQLIVYFGLAMAVYPAFFSLYPTVERLRHVRSLHYSNGVRALPLWLAYTIFDFLLVLATSVISIIIFRGVSDIWYHPELLFVVFFLYGLASTLLAYVISLFAGSQLAAFAFAAAGQAVMFLLYFFAYIAILTYAPTDKVNSYVNIAHFAIATVSPIASLTRALFATLNVFSIICRDRQVASYGGSMTIFGGPIVYLIVQIFFLFGLLLWWDSGPPLLLLLRRLRNPLRSRSTQDDVTSTEDGKSIEHDTSISSSSGLQVLNLNKRFARSTQPAVSDLSFSVGPSTVFALLGPNGAGKSTTISVIRGDMHPSAPTSRTRIEVAGHSVLTRPALARSHLGTCPQHSAPDLLTVAQHLYFYALIRGVSDPRHNVSEVLRCVGLNAYRDRMAATLSGGNQRKLSLGIALMGNPAVVLLDEPSSGMDAASKRVMWETLERVKAGRAMVLTTHSMEEAGRLAGDVGILKQGAEGLVARGTVGQLRREWANGWGVHVVLKGGDGVEEREERMARWIEERFEGAKPEGRMIHGQGRFWIPVISDSADDDVEGKDKEADATVKDEDAIEGAGMNAAGNGSTSVLSLFQALEAAKEDLDIEYYSVSQTTLDQVFLNVVGRDDAENEKEKKKSWWRKLWSIR
ncbi:MAG: hypothetical protein Q9160_008429 [Pyrenula sp. 1 TL-2023]